MIFVSFCGSEVFIVDLSCRLLICQFGRGKVLFQSAKLWISPLDKLFRRVWDLTQKHSETVNEMGLLVLYWNAAEKTFDY